MPEPSPHSPPGCSADRHPVVEADTASRAQVRAVGARFLRLRPWLVGGFGLVAAALLWGSSTPRGQLLRLGGGVGLMQALFIAEALWLRRHPMSVAWLYGSLLCTVFGISTACLMTGGLLSPALPLLLAPVVIAFAAFGQGARSASFALLLCAALIFLAIVGPMMTYGPLPAHVVTPLRALILLLVLALCFAGVAGLSQAYLAATRAQAAQSQRLIELASQHARELDAVGAQVAHEIKNPLAAIKGLNQLLTRAKDMPPRHLERLDVMGQELTRVEQLLNDYLAHTRHLSGLMLTPCSVAQCLEGLATLLQAHPLASMLTIDAQDAAQLWIRADIPKLRQALLNLLQNALEASPKSFVRLRVQASPGLVHLIIEDDGTGLSTQAASRYGQAQRSEKTQGSGLGVFIARQLVEQHGGALRLLSSQPGAGLRVALELPALPTS